MSSSSNNKVNDETKSENDSTEIFYLETQDGDNNNDRMKKNPANNIHNKRENGCDSIITSSSSSLSSSSSSSSSFKENRYRDGNNVLNQNDDHDSGNKNDSGEKNKRPRSTINASPSSSSSSSSNVANSNNSGISGSGGNGTGVNNIHALGISPPNFVSFEEIMKTANDISRMALVNEIVLNKDFKIEKKSSDSDTTTTGTSTGATSSSNALEKAVRENMQKAFWDILSEQLNESPPNYKQAISLLGEIKETLLLFLMPQHTQLKNEINDILDLQLIQQQADVGIFEYQRYAQYVLSVCSRLCCPARDEMIRKLTQTTQLIPLFRGIFELLDTMRVDFANFYIQQFRPHIQLASVEYERDKFKQLIQTHQKYHIDVLEYTTQWLKRNYQSLDFSQESDLKNLFNKLLTASYIDLLRCITPSFNCYRVMEDGGGGEQATTAASSSASTSTSTQSTTSDKLEDDYPETLLLMRARIDAIREKVFKVTLISSVFVITFAAIGEPLQSVKEFRRELKQQLDVLISPVEQQQSLLSRQASKAQLQYSKREQLKQILTSVSLQVIKTIEEHYHKHQNGPSTSSSSTTTARALDEQKLESLKYQIIELSSANSRIRSVMERRILEFIERVISSSTAVPIQVPSGLSSFATELTQIAGEFTRHVAYNRAVYSPYYTKIIADIASGTHFISPNDLKEIERALYE